MKSGNISRILVIQTASIGDVILITPVLEALHQNYPTASIDVLLRHGYASLFDAHPYIRQLLVWDKRKDKYAHLWQLMKQIRKERYNLVINAQRFFSTGILTAFSKAETSIGFDKNPLSRLFTISVPHHISNEITQVHEVDRNLSLLGSLVENPERKIKLYPSPKDEQAVDRFKTHPYICIAPASLWYTKQYPVERWISFLKKVDTAAQVYLLGAQNDAPLCEEIIKAAQHPKAVSLCGQLSLLESAALMRDAHMNFVNDSAPMHLCSAVNAPTTVVYCSTVPAFGFGPLSDNAVVVETKKPLKCRPCGLHGHQACPEKHFECASTIDEQALTDRL